MPRGGLVFTVYKFLTWTSHDSGMSTVYLVTFSHAERGEIENKRKFGEILEEAFNESFGPGTVLFWAAAQEPHAGEGHHFHATLKLDRARRFSKPSQWLRSRGINVHFAEGAEEGSEGEGNRGYHGALSYISKHDTTVVKSSGHPATVEEPRTASASRVHRESNRLKRSRFLADSAGEGEGREPQAEGKAVKLSKSDVGAIVLESGIHTFKELMVEAERRRRAGDNTLSDFILNRGQKAAEEVVKLANEMSTSIEEVADSQRSRVDVIKACLVGACTCKDPGLWRRLAEATLADNDIYASEFCGAVVDLLINGRSKGRNIFLVGKANCGKSFMVRPLERMYRALVNPASNSFSFAGIDGKEIVLLDDFRFTNGKPIQWADLLLLLDGGTVNFSLPRTHYASDVCVPASNTIPVFCTGKAVPLFTVGGQVDSGESEMLRIRFRVFAFCKQITRERACECSPCSRCFSEMLCSHAHQLKESGRGASSSQS